MQLIWYQREKDSRTARDRLKDALTWKLGPERSNQEENGTENKAGMQKIAN
jgi:hypothetical protein